MKKRGTKCDGRKQERPGHAGKGEDRRSPYRHQRDEGWAVEGEEDACVHRTKEFFSPDLFHPVNLMGFDRIGRLRENAMTWTAGMARVLWIFGGLNEWVVIAVAMV